MPRKKSPIGSENNSVSHEPPALTPEARESQLIALAVDLAEKHLREGTASSQVIVHYLKLATSRERMENEILKRQCEYLEAKTEAYRSASKMEATYDDVLEALKRYGGLGGQTHDTDIFRSE